MRSVDDIDDKLFKHIQDGTIEYEVKLTGELSTNALSPGETKPEYGTLVDPNVSLCLEPVCVCVCGCVRR